MQLSGDVTRAYNLTRNCTDKQSICHAPAHSMYFGRDGLVSACCYSRSNPLGSYPAQTIPEIWFGEKIKEMRAEMRRNILPKGCNICAEQLIAGNFTGLLAAHFDQLAISPSRTFAGRLKDLVLPLNNKSYPSRMEFELSNKCNLECSMCTGFFSSSIRANREGLPPLGQVYDQAFVEQLRPFVPHLTDAKFLGGEPFLIDTYYEIWELFIECNPSCNISITTNATVYTDKVKRVLDHLNCQIVISLDSLNKETYEGIRTNAVFSRTMSNLDAFTEVNHGKGKTLQLAVCPMVSNWHELPDIVSFANRRDMQVYFNTVVYPHEVSLKFLPGDEQARIVKFLRQSLRPPGNPLEAHNNRVLEDCCQQVQFWIIEPSLTQLVAH